MARFIALAAALALSFFSDAVNVSAKEVHARPTPVISCDPGFHPECVENPTPTPTRPPPTAVPTQPPPTAVPTSPPPTVIPIPPTDDVTKPTVRITYPNREETYAPSTKYVAVADAQDDVGVVSVQFKVNGGTSMGCTVTEAPWECEITMPPSGTLATINAYAKDAAGNTSSPAEVNVKMGVPTVPTVGPPTPIATSVPTVVPTVAPTAAPPTPGPSPTAAPTIPAGADMPQPVQREVDVTQPSTPSKWYKPTTAAELQQALDSVQPGEGIELQAGKSYVGNFRLRPKPDVMPGLVTKALDFVTGTKVMPLKVWIRSSGFSQLPASGTRVGAESAQLMGTLVSPNYLPALATIGAANNYYISGVEITTTNANGTIYNVVALGFQDPEGYDIGASTLAQLPDQIVFDRVYIHGTPTGNSRRGITINSRAAAVIDSTVKEIHEVGADNQAIGGWNGNGPFLIRNNWLEAACENVMFGGADTKIQNNSPSDLVFENNLVTKDFAWRVGDPSYAGIKWSVKNLFELKHMKRARIRFNIFDKWWPADQVATMQFTPRNSNNTNPWTAVEDIEFTYNHVGRNNFGSYMNFLAGISTASAPEGGPTQWMNRILVANNLIENVDGFAFQVLKGPINLKIIHNTVMTTDGKGMSLGFSGQPPAQKLVYADNIIGSSNYFVWGDATGVGDVAISKFAPDMILTNNAFYGPWPTPGGSTPNHIKNHPGNFFPPSRNAVGFVDLGGRNYTLSSNSPYVGKATDGKDVGADMSKVPGP